ncbi:MAG: hypothetical protein PHS29_03370, partial [Candidatus Pacebacteria bacterium]|nr:hypothetical protein [Candidatus Paceibacterota bacterium]
MSLFKNNLKRRKLLTFVSFFIFSFIFFTPLIAKGFDLGIGEAFDTFTRYLLSLVLTIPLFFIGIILMILVLLAQLLALLTRSILILVMSPYFISWSYTQPATNPIISQGLLVTQSLMNMILVLALLYIGIVTILGLESYNTKKLLITFIVIALLVNFAPVITGLIVDPSNILIRYFVTQIPGGDGGFISRTVTAHNSILGGFSHMENIWDALKGGLLLTTAGMVFRASGLLIVYLLISLAYLGFIVIFTARYFAIWLLVILSPIAFVCYILPETQGIARKWWNAFIQWTFIGVTGAFFLYLAEGFAMMNPALIYSSLTIPQGGGFLLLRDLVALLAPALFGVMLAIIGLMVSVSTSAIGAQMVLGVSKKYGKAGAIKGGKFLTRSIPSGLKEQMAKQTKTTLPGFEGKSGGGKFATGLGYATGVIPAYWATRKAVGAAGVVLKETEKKDRAQAKEKYKGSTIEKKMQGVNSPFEKERTAALVMANEEGNIGEMKKKYGLTDDTIKEIIKETREHSPDEFKKLRKTMPQYAKELVSDDELAQKVTDKEIKERLDSSYGITDKDEVDKILKDEEERNRIAREVIDDKFPDEKDKDRAKLDIIISQVKKSDVESWSSDVFDDEEVVKSILVNAKVQIIPEIAENFGEKAREKIQEQVDSGAEISASMHSYLTSNAGRAIFP